MEGIRQPKAGRGIWERLFGSGEPRHEDAPEAARYREVIELTAGMSRDRTALELAREHKLSVLDLTWEDTGRFKGSAVGPNISDMTIQVEDRDASGGYRLTCMPVIRYPNFADKSADLAMEDFFLRVGNERGATLRRVSLRDYLGDLRSYLSRPSSWAGERTSLLAARDKHVLVSAQACFLPVPKEGEARFNPVVFNYQSYAGAPAVLAILATREGTSATVIDNTRDGFSAGRTWGQRLFFNKNGERCSLIGTRMSDFLAAGGDATDTAATGAGGQGGLNMVLMIQVPLVQKEVRPMAPMGALMLSECETRSVRRRGKSDVEEAVIGHGAVEGPFTEIADLAIERDARFPVRVTVQFYKATSNGVVSPEDMSAIAAQIDRVYAEARYVGSLVTEGDTGRPTEWDAEGADKREPPGWWDDFWRRQEAATGRSRDEILADLRRVLGDDVPRTEGELRAAIERIR
jgi:hypothetical protein